MLIKRFLFFYSFIFLPLTVSSQVTLSGSVQSDMLVPQSDEKIVDLLEVLFDLRAFLRPDVTDFSDDSVEVLAHGVVFLSVGVNGEGAKRQNRASSSRPPARAPRR